MPPCKERRQCVITYTDRKLCTSCRYQKCLRSGMIPSLVLNEDDKRIRFKKLHQKKKEDLIKFRSLGGVENEMFYQHIDNEGIEENSDDNDDEDDDDDDKHQAHDYTRAYLTIQQYREEYLRKMTDNDMEEPIQDCYEEATAIRTGQSSALDSERKKDIDSSDRMPKLERIQSKSEPVDLFKNHLAKVESNNRFRQLLELSHQAAIYAKLQDTDFPLIYQHGFPQSVIPKLSLTPKFKEEPDATDSNPSEEERETLTDDSEERPVTSKHVYLQTRKAEQDLMKSMGDSQKSYHHKKFRTSQDQDQISIGVMLNRKRASVIVKGPNAKRLC